MSTELVKRSGNQCELCASKENLTAYQIPPNSDGSADQSILVCDTCLEQIENPETMDANHWRCLNDSMWTPVPAVQVMAWRLLNRIKAEVWPQDLLEMLYLEDEVKAWAEADSSNGVDGSNKEESSEITRDSNGAQLNVGDSVTLIKDLVVKGANFTAKRGTMVKGISLTATPKEIEGRINGTRIVLSGKYLKKA